MADLGYNFKLTDSIQDEPQRQPLQAPALSQVGVGKPVADSELERQLLGTLLVKTEKVPEVLDVLQPDDFSGRRPRQAYQLLIDAHSEG